MPSTGDLGLRECPDLSPCILASLGRHWRGLVTTVGTDTRRSEESRPLLRSA